MLETARNPNINLLTYAKVTDFKGYVGNYEVEVTKMPRYVKSNCNGCGACVDVCPAWGANTFDWGMSPRKAIYIAFAQAVPAKAQIDMNRCIKCGNCENVCELESINLNDEPEKVKLKVGTVVVATGWDEFKPEKGYLGYGVAKNVITQGQLERALAPNGPSSGNLLRPSDGKHPHSVLFIQCVGSRDKKHNAWCSAGVCCMISVKNAKLIQQHLPGSHIAVAYIDMRCGGKMYDEYYAAAREAGVLFLRGKVADVKENPKTEGVVAIIEDSSSNEMIEQEFDLVILSASMQAPNDLDELNSHLRLERSPDGFFKEYHARLNPVDAKVPGIHFAGVSQGPKSIAETIMQAKGAASSASIIMQKGEYTIDLIRAVVDLDRCSACGLCENACPYEAISMTAKGGCANVDEIRCRGCGTCCSVCPSASISLRYYRDGQYQAYIDALLEAEPLEPAK